MDLSIAKSHPQHREIERVPDLTVEIVELTVEQSIELPTKEAVATTKSGVEHYQISMN